MAARAGAVAPGGNVSVGGLPGLPGSLSGWAAENCRPASASALETRGRMHGAATNRAAVAVSSKQAINKEEKKSRNALT